LSSAGLLAVQQDLDGLRPRPVPATKVHPLADPLDQILGGRRLLHYCVAADAPSIQRDGLWPGSWCTVTPLSSFVADIWLGLPRRVDYVFEINPQSVPAYLGPGIALPGTDLLRWGNAVEFYLPDGVPPDAFIRHGPLEEL
jgi:hypothetical protein